jgi:hypothetical protein
MGKKKKQKDKKDLYMLGFGLSPCRCAFMRNPPTSRKFKNGTRREKINGSVYWYKNDVLHRDAGPAVIHADGREEWRQHGKLHRLDGPAIIYPNGDKFWYRHGLLHREDGPAHLTARFEVWYKDGKVHREDGAAYIDKKTGACEFKIEGVLHNNGYFAKIDAYGSLYWYKNGKLHRDNDLPAMIHFTGQRSWFKEGELHREKGPAVIFSNDAQEWWLNGKKVKPFKVSKGKSTKSGKKH